MLPYPLHEIDAAVLQRLVDDQVTERRDLEFKQELPGPKDSDKKEFIKDVTALANTAGGDLLYGVEDKDAVAVGLPGIPTAGLDAAILRLENMIKDNVSPRLDGVRVLPITLLASKCVIIVRIPASLAGPHRAHAGGGFFARHSRGVYEMDVDQVRAAFVHAGSLADRFRELHDRAVRRAQGEDMPFAIGHPPVAVASVMPLSLFSEHRDLAFNSSEALDAPGSFSTSPINLIEGIVRHAQLRDASLPIPSIACTHRLGYIDFSWSLQQLQEAPSHVVFPGRFEQEFFNASIMAQQKLKHLGLEGPWIIMASVYAALNYSLKLDVLGNGSAYRNQAFLGQVQVDRMSAEALLPIISNFWLLFTSIRPHTRALPKTR